MSLTDPLLDAEARAALAAYGWQASQLTPLTGGLINVTCRVDAADGRRAVLQCLHPVFAPEVNLNLELVTDALAARGVMTPRLLRTTDGRAWVTLAGRHWRLLSFVDGCSVDAIDTPSRATAAGALLARFHAALADCRIALPHRRPAVHEPPRHFAALAAAQARHPDHRLATAVARIAEAARQHYAALPPLPLTPLRLVHGDPKISNLLFDTAGRGLCLVDLDTLAEAPLAFELGDAFRSWCNPGAEDAVTPSFSPVLFEAALAGYTGVGRAFMSDAECAAVVPATAAICLELTARFAADALDEQYFGWSATRYPARGEHNLARAQNQLGVARDLLTQRAGLESTAARLLA